MALLEGLSPGFSLCTAPLKELPFTAPRDEKSWILDVHGTVGGAALHISTSRLVSWILAGRSCLARLHLQTCLLDSSHEIENSGCGSWARDVSGTLGVNITPLFTVEFLLAGMGERCLHPQQSASVKGRGALTVGNCPEMRLGHWGLISYPLSG